MPWQAATHVFCSQVVFAVAGQKNLPVPCAPHCSAVIASAVVSAPAMSSSSASAVVARAMFVACRSHADKVPATQAEATNACAVPDEGSCYDDGTKWFCPSGASANAVHCLADCSTCGGKEAQEAAQASGTNTCEAPASASCHAWGQKFFCPAGATGANASKCVATNCDGCTGFTIVPGGGGAARGSAVNTCLADNTAATCDKDGAGSAKNFFCDKAGTANDICVSACSEATCAGFPVAPAGTANTGNDNTCLVASAANCGANKARRGTNAVEAADRAYFCDLASGTDSCVSNCNDCTGKTATPTAANADATATIGSACEAATAAACFANVANIGALQAGAEIGRAHV